MGREVQRELNVDNVVYLNTSVRVGGLDVIHMRTALFGSPSSSSAILCLPLSLFRISSLPVLPFPTFTFHFNAHHCLTVLQPHPVSLFAASSVVRLALFFSRVRLHTYTLAPFCMTEVPIPAPSITTSTYPCQQAVRAVTAGKGGQRVNDCFTLHLVPPICLSIKCV